MSVKPPVLLLVTIVCVALGFNSIRAAENTDADEPGVANEPTAQLHQSMDVDDVRHLLMRTGLGAAPADILKLRGLSRQAGINAIIAGLSATSYVPMPGWVKDPLPAYHAKADMHSEDRARFNKRRDAELSQLRQWWILNMLLTSSAQTERLVLFWHNLFATNYHDLNKWSLAMARQNQTFRELGSGSWSTLLKAMIRDPALLKFLNSGSNHKASPNENLARELMELFTLGEGNYDEFTVKEAARALTGHDSTQFHDLTFRLKTWAQDRGEKQLFGQTGTFDGDALIDILLTQEAATRFLATRFWHGFVADDSPPEHWVDQQSQWFRQSGLQIETLYRNVLQSEEFWADEYRGAIVKSPVDLVIGTARTLNYPIMHWQRMPQWQSMIGMNLFAPPNVAGWKQGAAFITPGNILNRYKVARQLTSVPEHAATPGSSKSGTMNNSSMNSMAGESSANSKDATMSMSMRAAGKSQQNPDNATENTRDSASIDIQMAAEDYQGPVMFKVSLHADNDILWQSKATAFYGGRDTVLVGRIQNASDFNWQTRRISVPEDAMRLSDKLRIHFLNDAAGPDGDRNLYINGLIIGSQWLAAEHGTQRSQCEPESRIDAGKLYCAGFFEIAIRAKVPHTNLQPLKRKSDQTASRLLTASAVHLQWASKYQPERKNTLEIVLDNVKGQHINYRHVRFKIEKKPDEPIMLQLESLSCLPECVDTWPDCAWTDEHFSALKYTAFPLAESNNKRWTQAYNHHCQFAALNNHEKMLVSTILGAMPDILNQASKTPKVQDNPERFMPTINAIENEIKKADVKLADTPFAPHASELDINEVYAPDKPAIEPLMPPATQFGSFSAIREQLKTHALEVHELLLPAINVAGLPNLTEKVSHPANQYRKAIIEHPLFQLK